MVGILRLKHVRLETHNASASGLCRSTPSHCRWTGNLFTISQIMQEKRALRGVGSEHDLCPDRLILDVEPFVAARLRLNLFSVHLDHLLDLH